MHTFKKTYKKKQVTQSNMPNAKVVSQFSTLAQLKLNLCPEIFAN